MIIFYYKLTGEIQGVINGRIHSEDHFRMWSEEKDKTERIVIQWKPVKWFMKDGGELPHDCLDVLDENGDLLVFTADFEPDHEQKELFMELDKNSSSVYDYKVDVKTKKIKKEQG